MKSNLLKLAALLIASSPMGAQAIIIDADAFASGTDISNAFAGVTLTTVFANNPSATPTGTGSVFALTDPNASTGTLVFAQSATNSTWGDGIFEYLRVDFAAGATSVSLDFFANDSGGDSNAELFGFDSSGILVDSMSQAFVALGSPATLSVFGNIAYIFAYWDEITRVENGGLDNLNYTANVPEPTTLALLGIGLVGMGLARRRKIV